MGLYFRRFQTLLSGLVVREEGLAEVARCLAEDGADNHALADHCRSPPTQPVVEVTRRHRSKQRAAKEKRSKYDS